jgi:hypothetical protein
MLNHTRAVILATLVAATASVVMAEPTLARQVVISPVSEDGYARSDWADVTSDRIDVRSPQSRELDPTGGSFQGP